MGKGLGLGVGGVVVLLVLAAVGFAAYRKWQARRAKDAISISPAP